MIESKNLKIYHKRWNLLVKTFVMVKSSITVALFWDAQKQPIDLENIENVLIKISHDLKEIICAWVSFLIKLKVKGLKSIWKRDSDTGLRNF